MNILHVNAYANHGGAARMAYRLHKSLLKRGHQSRLLVKSNDANDPHAYSYAGRGLVSLLESACAGVERAIGLESLLHPSSFLLGWRKAVRDADVIHLHNLHGGYFSLLALPHLSRLKPCVWTVHDMWPISGHCACPLSCGRYRSGCGECPDLKQGVPMKHDMTRVMWEIKRWVHTRSKILMVCPSEWTAGVVKESPMSKSGIVKVIANGVDCDVFRPIEKQFAREWLGLPAGNFVIVTFGTSEASTRGQNVKGMPELREILIRLSSEKLPVSVVCIGDSSSIRGHVAGLDLHETGHVNDDRLLSLYLGSGDALVLPSIAETFSLCAVESMSAGTPVVAFDCIEPVLNGVSGLLVPVGDVAAMVERVKLLMSDQQLAGRLSAGARKLALEKYDISSMAESYLSCYRQAIEEHGRGLGDLH